MKVRKGQGFVSVKGLVTVVRVRAAVWGDQDGEGQETWPVLRVRSQTAMGDPSLKGEGRPVKYVQSGEELFLFPTPDGPYWLEIVYHGAPRRA